MEDVEKNPRSPGQGPKENPNVSRGKIFKKFRKISIDERGEKANTIYKRVIDHNHLPSSGPGRFHSKRMFFAVGIMKG